LGGRSQDQVLGHQQLDRILDDPDKIPVEGIEFILPPAVVDELEHLGIVGRQCLFGIAQRHGMQVTNAPIAISCHVKHARSSQLIGEVCISRW
jgi:hypothetical protein